MVYHWNIIGHEKELAHLEEDILKKTVHHAYLLVGPENIGKFRAAKTAAAILQCPNNFCHTCPTCIQVEKRCHADTIELEDDGESVKITTIREIIARLSMTSQSSYKILLIQNIGRLTDEAANCLLKTLEEPTERTIFFFTASRLREVPPTIISRMRTVKFRKLEDGLLRTALRTRYPHIDDETLNRVLILSLGRSGHALQLIENPEAFAKVLEHYRMIEFLSEKASYAARFMAMQNLTQDPKELQQFLELLTYYLRTKLLAQKLPEQRTVKTIETLHRAHDLLDRNVNTRLVLEHIMLTL